MNVETFYDNKTATFTYVLFDPASKECGVIDSVADYDIFSGRASMESADKVIDFINQNQLKNKWILETHVHADHITAAHYLKSKIGGKIGIGSGIKTVLDTWLDVFETANDTPSDGSQFDVLFEEGDTFNIGEYEVKVWHTPGHTPACASFLVDGKIFVGDTMFAMAIEYLIKTDHPGYAEVISEVLAGAAGFAALDPEEAFEGLPLTGFEHKYRVEGRPIHAER